MKVRSCICCLLIVGYAVAALAGRPAHGGKGQKQREVNSPPAPAAAAINPGEPPSASLGRFIGSHLAPLSSLSPETQGVSAAYRNDLSLMRVTFQANFTASAPEKKPIYQSSLMVCDALLMTIDEHDKAAADVAASQQVHGVPDVKDEKITTLRARNGYGKATRANNRKEAADNKRTANRANTNDAFMNSAVTNAWAARLAQLRQQIDAAYARELTLEQQAVAAPPPAK